MAQRNWVKVFGVAVPIVIGISIGLYHAEELYRKSKYPQNFPEPIQGGLMVFVDPVTQCHYISPVGSDQLIRRMAGDGIRQMGCGFVPPAMPR